VKKKAIKAEDPNAGLFFTDPALSRRIVAWAGVEGLRVCEPSAGDGSFVRELLWCERPPAHVVAYEILSRYATELKSIAEQKTKKASLEVRCENFLGCLGERFDLAIGNPPYESGNDRKHVLRMLAVARRVVVLVRSNFCHGQRRDEVFRHAKLTRLVDIVNRPVFYGPGNKGLSAQGDYCVVELVPRTGGDDVRRPEPVQYERWFA
jgi:hypothetical protein